MYVFGMVFGLFGLGFRALGFRIAKPFRLWVKRAWSRLPVFALHLRSFSGNIEGRLDNEANTLP